MRFQPRDHLGPAVDAAPPELVERRPGPLSAPCLPGDAADRRAARQLAIVDVDWIAWQCWCALSRLGLTGHYRMCSSIQPSTPASRHTMRRPCLANFGPPPFRRIVDKVVRDNVVRRESSCSSTYMDSEPVSGLVGSPMPASRSEVHTSEL